MMTHTQLVKTDNQGTVDWFLPDSDYWSKEVGWDKYFTDEEIDNLHVDLRKFVRSEFCEVTEL